MSQQNKGNYIIIDNNQITENVDVDFNKIEKLFIKNSNNVSYSNLNQLTELKELYLYNCNAILPIKMFTKLELLYVNESYFNYNMRKQCYSLKYLILHDCEIDITFSNNRDVCWPALENVSHDNAFIVNDEHKRPVQPEYDDAGYVLHL